MEKSPHLTVYYDASCALCRAEIETLDELDQEEVFSFRDCSAQLFADRQADRDGVDRNAMMQAIHVRDSSGRWYRGVDAFAMIYRSAGIESVARLYASRRLRPLLLRGYRQIARHRQLLSRFRVHKPFVWLIRWVARHGKRSDFQPR